MTITKRMMKISMLTAAAAWALAHIPLPAHASEALAKEKGCPACHTTGTKLIGPPYKDVAAKYKADKEAPARLQASVLKGSQGKWGPIPMPPNKVSEEEAKLLVAWVLAL